ncbi:MAG TPA: MFS transporter [Verrucomicrobiota bacterium]|nr:MFS transporter [Verrucomicrobiota bacterium]
MLSASSSSGSRSPWAWIPTLYLAQGLPYAVVNVMSIILYKNMEVSNAEIAFYTSWLNLPWVLKPFWSPVVDILKTRRLWIWITQLLVGAGFAAVGLAIPAPFFFKATLILFWIIAFSSATHDIAADGFYMLALPEKQQAYFVGVRSTFFRVAMITGQGLLVILAGFVQERTGLPPLKLEVETQPDAPLVETIDSSAWADPIENSGELRLIISSSNVVIRPEPASAETVDAVLSAAKNWNVTNAFVGEGEGGSGKATAAADRSWWHRNVSAPLGAFLRERLGRNTEKATTAAGNLGVTQLRLSAPPGRRVVATVAFADGDRSISIAEGTRLVFDDTNWNRPAVIVFQLDPKLRHATRTHFVIRTGNIPFAWTVTFAALAGFFLLLAAYHRFILPRPVADRQGDPGTIGSFLREFLRTFGSYFRRNRIGVLLLFLLLYRFAEAQLVRMVAPFLLDAREAGGLGLTTGEVGFIYGTVGIIALTLGGILGGMLVSRHGLKAWLWPMVIIMHVPDAVFVYLAWAQPVDRLLIGACVAAEQFGYGFGFTAYMLYMIYIARGPHQTAHYAICTGFMAAGLMVPGMWSGWLQEQIGYQHFFTWVLIATLPGFLVTALIPLEKDFGRKAE